MTQSTPFNTEQKTQTGPNPPDRPRGSVAKLLKRGFSVYLRPYWKSQTALALTVIISIAFHTALPFSLKLLIDSALAPRDAQMLIFILGGMGALFGLYALTGLVQAYILAQLGTTLKAKLRMSLFTHLQDLPISYFDAAQPGEITALFAKELLSLRTALRNLTVTGFRAFLTVIVTIGALVALNWQLSLIVALALALMVFIPRWIFRRSTAADYAEQLQDAQVSHAVQDSIAAQPLIRAFGLRDLAIARFAKTIGQNRSTSPGLLAQLKRGVRIPYFMRSMVVVWTDIQQMASIGLAICVGAYFAWRGLLTVGTFSAFIMLLAQLSAAVTGLSAFFRDLISGASALERIEGITNLPPVATEPPNAVTLPPICDKIRFANVSFAYPGQPLQLKHVSFAFPAKKSIAFVGRSGAGKSTLLKLLLRFYDPTEGRIMLDGFDLRAINQASYRAQIGVVLQDAPLLNTTVRENICLAEPDAAGAKIEAAAKLAEIHDTIVHLPLGYNTPVGEGGKWFSAGERQRIALARALLRNPTLLLLDEITAALDPETEAAINATLKKLAQTRTVIIVTHRLPAVIEADQVVVVDNGQVVEQGTHLELLKNGGPYSRLWQLQTGFVITANGQQGEVTGTRLRFIPLFNRLDDAALETLAGQFVSEYYDAEQTVCAQGDPGDKFYIIARGKVSVSSALDPGTEAIAIAQLEDGDYFGEIALIEHAPRSATVKTILPSLFLTLERERFEKMMADLPDLQALVEQKAHQRSLETIATLGNRRPPSV